MSHSSESIYLDKLKAAPINKEEAHKNKRRGAEMNERSRQLVAGLSILQTRDGIAESTSNAVSIDC